MRARVFAVVALAALPLGAFAASAEQGRGRGQEQGRGQGQMRFRGMDRNDDGRITRAEWRGSAQSFRQHDWDNNGVLEGDEVRPGGVRPGTRDRDYDPSRSRDFDDWTVEGFQYLDHNRDGRISRDEWHYDLASFIRADRNRDNILTRAEFLSEDEDLDREDRFEDLDANNNNRIERSEWHGSTQAFNWLDQNNDGVLSRREVVGTDQASTKEDDLFASLDYNRDGRLSQEEWHWSRRSFLQQDTDRDGVVSRNEFSAPATSTTTGTTGGADNRPLNTPVVVNVNATERWTDTGIDLRVGDVLRITSTGSIRLSGNSQDSATAGGANRRADNAPMMNHPAGALIARISNGSPFFIGDGTNINRVTAAGRLYLSVNDDHLNDNSGMFRVTVVVRPQ